VQIKEKINLLRQKDKFLNNFEDRSIRMNKIKDRSIRVNIIIKFNLNIFIVPIKNTKEIIPKMG
jgi:hypothetical protein